MLYCMLCFVCLSCAEAVMTVRTNQKCNIYSFEHTMDDTHKSKMQFTHLTLSHVDHHPPFVAMAQKKAVGGWVNKSSFMVAARFRATSCCEKGQRAFSSPVSLGPCNRSAFGFFTGCSYGLVTAVILFVLWVLSQ